MIGFLRRIIELLSFIVINWILIVKSLEIIVIINLFTLLSRGCFIGIMLPLIILLTLNLRIETWRSGLLLELVVWLVIDYLILWLIVGISL